MHTKSGIRANEQVHPRVLLVDAVHAERAGFDAVMCSDHLAPWTQAGVPHLIRTGAPKVEWGGLNGVDCVKSTR
jgi:alkanesulfonate monooxygenase SsuD/methylene tetrahydromethanopterin reductase-like flavin-dependent oxidoreductase (luciferase family)